jgi:uncharacterized protein DUF6461
MQIVSEGEGSRMSTAGVSWIEDEGLEGYWILAVRGISPRELLRRAGCVGEELSITWDEGTDLEIESGCTLLRSVESYGWSFGFAQYGPVWDGEPVDAARRLSTGTEAIDFSRTTNFDTYLIHASDGEATCWLDPLLDPVPRGSHPEVLIPVLQEAGLLNADAKAVTRNESAELDPVRLTLRMLETHFALSLPRSVMTDAVLTMRMPA